MFQHTDRHDFVELRVYLAKVGLPRFETLAQAPLLDLTAQPFDLLGGGVYAAHPGLVPFNRPEHESAKAAADVDDALARLQADLIADVIDLVALRLFYGACAGLPVRAGVHHQRLVQPVAIKIGAQRVVKTRIGLGLRHRAVTETQLVPLIAQPDERSRSVTNATLEAGREGFPEVALDVQRLSEVGLEYADVPEADGVPLRARGLVAEMHERFAGAILE